MANEVIDSLFVRLGLQSDEKQFQQAESQFHSLQSTVLQFGAIIGAGFGLRELTTDFASVTNEANKLAQEFEGLEVTPQFVSDLRGAFRLIDEDAGEAESTIRSLAGIIEATDWGELSSSALARGFDLRGIQDAENATEALAALNDQIRGMEDPERARRMADALGLSSAQFRIMRNTDVGGIMQRSSELRPLTDEMSEAASEFQRGWAELALAMEGLQDEISESFVGDLGRGMQDVASAIAENREEIREFWDEAKPILTGMLTALTAMAAFRAARAGLGALSSIPGATLLAGGVAGAIFDRLNEDEDIRDDRDVGMHGPAREGGYEPPDDEPALFDLPALLRGMREGSGAGDPVGMHGPTPEQRIERIERVDRFERVEPSTPTESSVGEPAPVGMHGPTPDQRVEVMPVEPRVEVSTPVMDMPPPQQVNGARTENRYDIRVDARESTDPAAVERAAERGTRRAVEQAADNTREDMASEAQ